MKKVWWILLILTAVGFFLRFYEFSYGLPGFYVSDTQAISEAMEMGDALMQRNWDFFRESVKYPFITPYIFLFANGIVFWMAGVLSSAADVLKFIAAHQEIPFLTARFLSILFGTAIIPLSFFTVRLLAKRFGSERPDSAALISAFFSAFSLLLFQFSRMERPHIVLGFFTLLSYFLYLRFIEKSHVKNGLLLGLAVGLASGTLQNGILTALFLILPLILLFFRNKSLSNLRAVGFGFLIFAILIFLSYPYLFSSPTGALNLSSRFDITFSGGKHDVVSFGGQGFYAIPRNFLSYEPAIFILAVISIILLCSSKKRLVNFLKADAFGITAYSIIFLLVFGLYNATLTRFLIPLILLMIILFSTAIPEFIMKRRLGIIILSSLCLFSFIQVLRMTLLLTPPDTRDLATQWVKDNLTRKDTILLDTQNIATPSTKESILRGSKLGAAVTRRDALMLSFGEEDYPEDAKNILRRWQFEISDYKKFIQENNITHIIVSDSKGFHVPPSSLSVFAEENFKLKQAFSPFRWGSDLISSNFPDEFANPIIDLWGISRMGPEVRIYEKP